MSRFFSLSLVALVICALALPAFGLFCEVCRDDGVCIGASQPGTQCDQFIDWCVTEPLPCNSSLPPLSEQLTIASVEIVTPAGVTKSEVPRVAAQQPSVKTTAALSR
jgi:hypothetical protein